MPAGDDQNEPEAAVLEPAWPAANASATLAEPAQQSMHSHAEAQGSPAGDTAASRNADASLTASGTAHARLCCMRVLAHTVHRHSYSQQKRASCSLVHTALCLCSCFTCIVSCRSAAPETHTAGGKCLGGF